MDYGGTTNVTNKKSMEADRHRNFNNLKFEFKVPL